MNSEVSIGFIIYGSLVGPLTLPLISGSEWSSLKLSEDEDENHIITTSVF